MKIITKILLLLLISSVAIFGQDKKLNYGFANTDDVKVDGYEFKFLRAETNKNHWRMGYFKFRWKGAKEIRLWGFGFEKDGSFRVRFEQFSKATKGQWKERSVGYCGTGAEMFTFKPNKDYVLQIPLWPYKKGGDEGVVKLSGEKISVISKPFKISDLTDKL